MLEPRAFELVISCGNLCLLRRFGQLADIIEEVMVEALGRGRALPWVNFEHELEQIFKHAVLLAPLVVNDIVEQEHA